MFSYIDIQNEARRNHRPEQKQSHYEYLQEKMLGPALKALTELEPKDILLGAQELTSVLPIEHITSIYDPALLATFKTNAEAYMIRLGADVLENHPEATPTYHGLQILLNMADTWAEVRNYNRTLDGSKPSLRLMNESSQLLEENPGLFGETGIEKFNAFNKELKMLFGGLGPVPFPQIKTSTQE